MSDRSVPPTFIVFDVLCVDGEDLTQQPFSDRRRRLEGLGLSGAAWTTSPLFKDGDAVWATVGEFGLEGVVAKKEKSRYLPGERGWIKTKNPSHWRRDSEREAMARKRERQVRRPAA